ncbi:zinc metalloproteinase nas-6-like [Amblyomma americanum]
MMAGYFEGDIVLPEDGGRSAWDEPPKPWPDATIPYEVDPRLARDEQFIVLEKAMKMIQIRTCLRFVKRSSERDYIYLFPGEGCYSYVGYQGMGEQVVSLGKGCLYLGTALHELLHAAGFHHEHTRYDRDDYLKINMENVIPVSGIQVAAVEVACEALRLASLTASYKLLVQTRVKPSVEGCNVRDVADDEGLE